MISLHAIRITYNSEFKIHLPYLLFLIMLKHSDNNRYKEFLEIIKNKRTSNKPFEVLMSGININHTKIKINTKINVDYKTSDTSIPLISILEKFIDFYSMTHYNFNNQKNKFTIIKKIIDLISPEVPRNLSDEKINISIFKYPSLVEHTGQLS